MSFVAKLKSKVRRLLGRDYSDHAPRPSAARIESNRWLRQHCQDVKGKILSIGSGYDHDHEGDHYRNYFPLATSYTTSEATAGFPCDLVLDVRSMPQVESGSYDGIYCSGVLEHVDDYQAGLNEITRILKDGGILLLGLPFRQSIHMKPNDFWRFTEFGIRFLLKDHYEILELAPLDQSPGEEFPAAYWTKARKTSSSS